MRIRLVLSAAALVALMAGCSASGSTSRSSSGPASRPASTSVPPTAPTTSTPTTSMPTTSTPSVSTSPDHVGASIDLDPPTSSTARPVSRRPSHGTSLPLSFATHDATQVITVTASSTGSTTARLQAWNRMSSGWRQYGGPVTAHLGSDGISRHPSESRSATPIGSFTLTQAFGHDTNPGTSLPYTHTNPNDWWVSQPGPLYNTRQRCASGCSFTRGDPNEHLYYETPFYDYAVVIDYNTRNAPGGVRQGAGSAFFLHVTDGNPTAGCVSIPADRLTHLMRWLTPSRHPRILIGVG